MTMMNALLVPLDGSPLAETALPWAEAIARLTGATMTLLRVVEPIEPLFELTGTWEYTNQAAERQEEAERAASAYLTSVADRLATRGVSAVARVSVGPPPEMILQAEREADLVIMASHGRTGPERWVFGSVTDKVLRGAATPVLLVPARAGQAAPVEPLRRLVVPLDGSPLAEQALPVATHLARCASATIVLTHSFGWALAAVADYPAFFASGQGADRLIEQATGHARAYLENLVARLRAQGVTAEIDLRPEPAAEAILASVDAQHADIIVMTSHGRGGLGRWVYGSVADRVLRAATHPVLLVRARSLVEEVSAAMAGEHVSTAR
jgi:nucleotide-binding universal stress UspA family protein